MGISSLWRWEDENADSAAELAQRLLYEGANMRLLDKSTVKSASLLMTLVFVLAGGGACQRKLEDSTTQPAAGKIVDGNALLVYVPRGIDANRRVPVVLALSPGGDAPAMVAAWKDVADRRRWIIAVSKRFHNGLEWESVFSQLESDIASIKLAYPVDPARVIVTGFSGGATASHAIAQQYPGQLRAVVANTGMIAVCPRRGRNVANEMLDHLIVPLTLRAGLSLRLMRLETG